MFSLAIAVCACDGGNTHQRPDVLPCCETVPNPTGNCKAVLKPAGEAEEDGYDDEYALEDLEVAASDYIKPTLLGNFRAAWEGLPQEAEV